jgi:multiple sugar transport system substrate-binding protein
MVAGLLVMLMSVSLTAAQDGGTLSIWTKFNDQNPQVNTDRWIASTIEAYATATGVTLENTFLPFDQINSRLNVAVQAGGDVPAISYVDSQNVGFFFNNGTLMDLTDYVTNAPWFADVDPQALAACTTPDGQILCVPSTATSFFMYYWTDLYPEGFPATSDEVLAAGEALAADGHFAVTFKGSEAISVERVYYGLIKSAGGEIANAEGQAIWANEEVAAVAEYIRALYQNGYAPEVILAPAFEFEEPFKAGEAGGFYAGSFSYVYLTPMTAPSGEVFEEEITGEFDPNALAIGDAFDAGELAFAPPVTMPGGTPSSLVVASAWGIPNGSPDVEGAMAFIDYQMQTDINAEFAFAYGALPTLLSALENEAFATGYWQTIQQYQSEYAVAAPTFADYDLGMLLLSQAFVNIITDPNADIMAELQAAQDEYNFAIE